MTASRIPAESICPCSRDNVLDQVLVCKDIYNKKWENFFSSLGYNGVEIVSKINKQSAERGYERVVERIVHKFIVRNYVSMLEYP